MSGRTRFRAEGRAVYMVTPSGKQLCVASHTDWLTPEYIAGALQAARDRESVPEALASSHFALNAAAAELVKIRYGPEAEVRPLDVDLAKRILLAAGVRTAAEPVPASERGEEDPG